MDFSGRVWRDPDWLATFGVTATNVLEYFMSSPFFDRQSNNASLRMQTMYSGHPPPEPGEEAEQLKRFVGVEFALVSASEEQRLFVLEKRDRKSPTDARTIGAYYVLNGDVFQASDLFTLFSTRMLGCMHSLRSSLDLLRSRSPAFDPRVGHHWPLRQIEAADTAADIVPDAPTPADSAREETPAPGKAKVISSVDPNYLLDRALERTLAAMQRGKEA